MDLRKNWWSISIILIVFGLFCIVIPIEAWKGNVSINIIVDIVSIFISWPVAVLVIGLLFILRFQSAIDFYLRNIGLMKLPGGVEIQSQQSTNDTTSNSESQKNLVLTPEQQKNIEDFIVDLEGKQKLSEEERRALSQRLDEMSHIAIEWKFRYLNMFLVLNTKNVLHWFSNNSPQTRESYNTLWHSIINDEEQRSIILDVLIFYGLLLEANGFINITDHGYSFLQFIGLIPPTPKVSVG